MFNMSAIGRNACVQTFTKVVDCICWWLSAASYPGSAAEHFSALKWFLALDEFCEMPEAWHSTHDSQVDWDPVNWVAIRPLQCCRQPVLRLMGRVSRSAVLLKYKSVWKQLFAVISQHRQQTSCVISHIDFCLLFNEMKSTLSTEANSRWYHDVTCKFCALHQQSTWFNVLLESIWPHSVVLTACWRI